MAGHAIFQKFNLVLLLYVLLCQCMYVSVLVIDSIIAQLLQMCTSAVALCWEGFWGCSEEFVRGVVNTGWGHTLSFLSHYKFMVLSYFCKVAISSYTYTLRLTYWNPVGSTQLTWKFPVIFLCLLIFRFN